MVPLYGGAMAREPVCSPPEPLTCGDGRMTQSGYPPTDSGSSENPDPSSSSPLGDQSSWYTPWTPDPSSTPPLDPPPGSQLASAEPPPDLAAPWGVPGPGAVPQAGSFGTSPNAAGPPPSPYG